MLTGNGRTVFTTEHVAAGERIRVNFTAVGGRLATKTYAADALVEVVRPPK